MRVTHLPTTYVSYIAVPEIKLGTGDKRVFYGEAQAVRVATLSRLKGKRCRDRAIRSVPQWARPSGGQIMACHGSSSDRMMAAQLSADRRTVRWDPSVRRCTGNGSKRHPRSGNHDGSEAWRMACQALGDGQPAQASNHENVDSQSRKSVPETLLDAGQVGERLLNSRVRCGEVPMGSFPDAVPHSARGTARGGPAEPELDVAATCVKTIRGAGAKNWEAGVSGLGDHESAWVLKSASMRFVSPMKLANAIEWRGVVHPRYAIRTNGLAAGNTSRKKKPEHRMRPQ